LTTAPLKLRIGPRVALISQRQRSWCYHGALGERLVDCAFPSTVERLSWIRDIRPLSRKGQRKLINRFLRLLYSLGKHELKLPEQDVNALAGEKTGIVDDCQFNPAIDFWRMENDIKNRTELGTRDFCYLTPC
jgi:hypothetical protein